MAQKDGEDTGTPTGTGTPEPGEVATAASFEGLFSEDLEIRPGRSDDETPADADDEEQPSEKDVEAMDDLLSDDEDSDDVDADADEPDDEDDDADEASPDDIDDDEVVDTSKDKRADEDARLRQADYTRKTQELAEERKQVAAAREQYAERLDALAREFTPTEKEPDWDELRREDPDLYARTYADFQIQKGKLAKIYAERQRVQDEAQQEFVRAHNDEVDAARERLVVLVPKWKDPVKLKRAMDTIVERSRELYGFTIEDFAAIKDHRLVLMARDAVRFRNLEKSETTVRGKAKKAPVVRPGARKRSETSGKARRRKAMAAAKEKGTATAAAGAFFEILGDDA